MSIALIRIMPTAVMNRLPNMKWLKSEKFVLSNGMNFESGHGST